MSRPLVDVLFPGDPSIGAAEASEEAARQRHEARQWLSREQQDTNSKCQPLTESEALWRIELALLRVARALESSNDR